MADKTVPEKFHVVKKSDEKDRQKFVQEMMDLKSDNKNMMKLYEQWAPEYDQYIYNMEYSGPRVSAEKVAELFPGNKDIRVMDAACGTGLTGVQLRSHGFKNVDALDGCPQMIEQAEKKHVYDTIVCAMLGEKRLPFEDATYDMTMSCGACHLGHIPGCALIELSRITKPGGYMVFLYYQPDVKDRSYDIYDYAVRLESEGKWKVVEKQEIPKYWIGEPGILVTCKVLK